MPTIIPRLRFHVEHQTAPSWPSEVVMHDECGRHTRKLWRTPCGCMRYGTQTARPKARIYTASGLVTETNIARLFLTMSADRPLQGTDYACHRCDDPLCAHPDHLMVGNHHTNVLDKGFPGRRIRPRTVPRFYDPLLREIAEHSPAPVVIGRPRQTPAPLDRPEYLKTLHPSVMRVPSQFGVRDLSRP